MQVDYDKYDRSCEFFGQEHNSHWLPLDDDGNRFKCFGWHAINRGVVRTEARFHAPYLRGAQSNLIHRSAHVGDIDWMGPAHSYGYPEYVWYRVNTTCPLSSLKNPELLDAAGVRSAKPYSGITCTAYGKYSEITLCGRCFPTGDNEECRILTRSERDKTLY